MLDLLFTCLIYFLFFRQFLGPVIGGALVHKVGFRSMPAVRLSDTGTICFCTRNISVFCVCLMVNLHTQFCTIKYSMLYMTVISK